MKLREKITLEEVCGKTFKIQIIETYSYHQSDNKLEIFSQILLGNSGFTKELCDYNVSNIEVIKLENGKK